MIGKNGQNQNSTFEIEEHATTVQLLQVQICSERSLQDQLVGCTGL